MSKKTSQQRVTRVGEQGSKGYPAAEPWADESFSEAVEKNMRRVFHTALRITRNREDAEDAAQQSLLNAFTHREQFRGQSAFSTWLTRIAINEALGRLRKGRSEQIRRVNETEGGTVGTILDRISAGEESSPEVAASQGARRQMLREAIGGLRGESRAIVWLLGIHERPIKEAAQALNISESAAKARFYRARRQLRECLAGRV